MIEERIEREAAVPAELWAWLLQRVTGLLMGIILIVHIWVLHFAVVGEKITFERVSERLQSPFFVTLDILLLALLIYHSLNGLRVVIADFGIGGKALSILTWIFVVIGVVGFVYGANALLPFTSGQPWF